MPTQRRERERKRERERERECTLTGEREREREREHVCAREKAPALCTGSVCPLSPLNTVRIGSSFLRPP